MKRLLIVDDEHHIVNWLVELFEDQKDLDLIIYKAYSGLEALKILETNKIDIILLDIKMPGINGLEVSKKILTDWPSCRIIFLTGYNHFDYIYQANKHKNITYLLKTEDDDEIINAVTIAIRSIESEIKHIELKNEVKSKEKLVKHLFQKEILRDILLGKHLTEIQAHMNKFEQDLEINLNKPVYLLYGKLNSVSPTQFFVEHSNRILKLIQITEKLFHQKFNYAILDHDNTTIIWLLQPTDYFDETNKWKPINYLKESFDDFILSCQNYLSQDISLLLYYKAINWDNLSYTFKLVDQYKFRQQITSNHSYGMLFTEKDEEELQSETKDTIYIQNSDKLLNELATCLHQGETDNFMNILKIIESYCNEIKSMHHLQVIGVYQRISAMLIHFINQNNLNEDLSTQIGTYPLYYLNDFKSWDEAFTFLECLSKILFGLSTSTQNDKNLKLIKTLKTYVKNNLSKDLTLSTLSDMVNYNSSYVSRLFKQVTGVSLSDFINHSRIDKAKELLVNTNDTVQVIAQKVGFDTSQYFSLVFRKSVGLSPRDYRSK